MRFNGIFYIIISTLVLISLVIMVYFNFPFSLVFFTTLAGQILLIFTVYKVLTDDYSTEKTFDDWYEDHPIGKD